MVIATKVGRSPPFTQTHHYTLKSCGGSNILGGLKCPEILLRGSTVKSGMCGGDIFSLFMSIRPRAKDLRSESNLGGSVMSTSNTDCSSTMSGELATHCFEPFSFLKFSPRKARSTGQNAASLWRIVCVFFFGDCVSRCAWRGVCVRTMSTHEARTRVRRPCRRPARSCSVSVSRMVAACRCVSRMPLRVTV